MLLLLLFFNQLAMKECNLTRLFRVLGLLLLLHQGHLLLNQLVVHVHARLRSVLRLQVVQLTLHPVHPRPHAVQAASQHLLLLVQVLQLRQHLLLQLPQLRGVAGRLLVPQGDPVLVYNVERRDYICVSV